MQKMSKDLRGLTPFWVREELIASQSSGPEKRVVGVIDLERLTGVGVRVERVLGVGIAVGGDWREMARASWYPTEWPRL